MSLIGKRRAHKGQAIMPEYIITFFIVMTVVSALTVFVQRALQGRVRDARNYMVDMASRGCVQANTSSTDCLGALGTTNSKLLYEYEPYYTTSNSFVNNDQLQRRILNGPITESQLHNTMQVSTVGQQLDPQQAK